MEKLCRQILGGEDIKYANTSPQDWYDHFKAYAQKIAQLNSPQWVEDNYPKTGVLLKLGSMPVKATDNITMINNISLLYYLNQMMRMR